MKKLIVTADDFGLSLPVNEAVEQAHRHGILTAASLMMGAPACADAVRRARALPDLGVGLHVTLINGRPVLPPEQVSALVGPDGRFFNDPVRSGIALFFSAQMRRQAAAEIRAQFETFERTGLAFDHINGHLHFHMHPVISQIVAGLAPKYGAPPIRIPIEPVLQSYAATSDRIAGRIATWLFFFVQTRLLRWRAIAAGCEVNDFVFGLNDSGAMVEHRVLSFLDHLPAGIGELYFHPATERWSGADNLPDDYRPVDEFSALTSRAVRQKIDNLGVRLASYRGAFKDE